MSNFTFAPMASHQSKIAGLIVLALSVIALFVIRIHGPFPFINKDVNGQFKLFFVGATAGMYFTAFSKEKNDDERVQKIRAKALQSSFMMMAGTMLAISLTHVITNADMDLGNMALSLAAAYGLAVYLLLFHIGLYFDPPWAYNDDTVIPNMRKNKTFFIIYFVVIALMFAFVLIKHFS